uniref:VOC domain-containing protein n=1 Tax=Physcomitrium patens TaxID=3218 RepID=A0A2K1IGI3_PHYPA|nr:hypothetical protein PHYPA_028976 [Physcomitrium patens]
MRDSVDLAMEDISPFQGVHLHHIARETSDVHCLLDFYQQLPCLQICDFVFGFKKLEASQLFGDFHVTWLHLSPIYSLHVVERDPKLRLLESPFVVPSDAKTQQEGKIKQCFFFDPDGNGLEIGNWPTPT